jgi:hypothetical protein
MTGVQSAALPGLAWLLVTPVAAEAATAVLLLRQGCEARPTIRPPLGTAADMRRDPDGATG